MAVITGDIAFLYDINALLSARLITKPLVIFVINNGGGNIFSSLPIQQAVPDSMDWFITLKKSPSNILQSYGFSYTKIVDSDQLWDNDWAEEVQQVFQIHTKPSLAVLEGTMINLKMPRKQSTQS